MIRDHVKARIEAIKAGHMPKITLEEYNTLLLNMDEIAALLPSLTEDTLKQVVEKAIGYNCTNPETHPLQISLLTGIVRYLQDKIPCRDDSTVGMKLSWDETWELCMGNPKARVQAEYRTDGKYYIVKGAASHPFTKEKKRCLINADYPESCFSSDFREIKGWSFKRLPDAE